MPQKLVRSWMLSFADETKASLVPPFVQVLNWLFGLLIVAGMGIVLLRFRPAAWLLFTPVVAWIIKTIVFYGSARQTALVLPVLMIFAGVMAAVTVELYTKSR